MCKTKTILLEWGLNQSFHDCQFQDPADDCTFYFRYVYDEFVNDTIEVWIREKKGEPPFVVSKKFLELVSYLKFFLDCPPAIPILAIVLGVIAGIVLIGLVLLLLWKLLTIIHDRREYAKFEKERLMARWDTVSFHIFCIFLLVSRQFDVLFLGRESDISSGYNDI